MAAECWDNMAQLTMEEILTLFWQAFGHLFPPHAKAVQTAPHALTISWPMSGDRYAKSGHASPITIRFEPELIEALKAAPADQRPRILQRHEPVLRGGMIGYDPYASIPKARVIVLG